MYRPNIRGNGSNVEPERKGRGGSTEDAPWVVSSFGGDDSSTQSELGSSEIDGTGDGEGSIAAAVGLAVVGGLAALLWKIFVSE